MSRTPAEIKVIDEHDHERQEMMREHLGQLGIQLRIAHFSGDSSYPSEYTFTYGSIQAVGPTFDLALVAFIKHLL